MNGVKEILVNIDWENAINIRRSTRSFEMTPVEDSKMELIKSFADNFQVPFEHSVKIRMFKANPDKKLYTVFSSPPDGAAFITNTDALSVSASGFIGELFILYATSLGLTTCWYGHYLLSELERIMPHLGEHGASSTARWGYGKGIVEGERAICITPVGYWQKEGMRLFDRMQTSFISYKRKPVNAFLEDGVSEENLPTDLLYAFDLARKAPSAANSQHWRFKVSPDYKTITIAMPVGYKHIKWEHPDVDIGICACHFWIGLAIKNMDCKVSLTEDQGRAVWHFEIFK